MFDQIDRLFPNIVERVRHLSVPTRLLLLAALVAGPIATKSLADHWPNVSAWWARPIALPRYSALLAITIAGFLSVALLASTRYSRRQRALRNFFREWLEFRSSFALFQTRIDSYLEDVGSFDDKVMPYLPEYWERRSRLRELLFIIGEDTLNILDSQSWRSLKASEAIFNARDYATPFSFLLDLGSPVGTVKHHGDAVWRATLISDDYVEHLAFQHRSLKRLLQASEPPVEKVQLADQPT